MSKSFVFSSARLGFSSTAECAVSRVDPAESQECSVHECVKLLTCALLEAASSPLFQPGQIHKGQPYTMKFVHTFKTLLNR